MSSGKGLTLVKTTLLPGQERVTVVASLPTSPSCDVTANIPICVTVNLNKRIFQFICCNGVHIFIGINL